MFHSESNRRLSVAMVMALTVGCVAVAVTAVAAQLWASHVRTEHTAIQAAHHLGHTTTTYVERVLEGVDVVLADLAEEVAAAPDLGAKRIRDRNPSPLANLTTILLLDRDGGILLRSRNRPGGERLPAGTALPPPTRKTAVSCVVVDGEGYMFVVRRRLDAGGAPTGFIAGVVALDQFQAILLNEEEPSLAAIYGRDGTLCAPVGAATGGDLLPVRLPAGTGAVQAGHSPADGAVVAHEIGESEITVASFVDWREALAPWRRDSLPVAALASALVVVLAGGAAFLIGALNRSFAYHNGRIGDITELNTRLQDMAASSRAAQQASEERFRAVFTHGGIGIAVLTPDGRLVDVNPRFRQMVGEPAGTTEFAGLLHPEDRERLDGVLARLGTGTTDSVSTELRSPGMPPRLMEVTFTTQRGDGLAPPLVIAMSLDVTGRKLAEMAMEDARQKAEKASDAKSRFLAAAAHDLRQPLQALTMFVEELSYFPLPAPCREVVAKVDASTHALSALLNGLLDIGALDSGMTVPRPAEVPIAPILEGIDGRFGPLAEAKGLELRMVPCGAVVHTDPVLLTRILSNFVSNAIRYTESGRILVGCRRQGGHLRVMVADTGVGIAEDQLPLIFEEYYQVENSGRDRWRGTGLGLAIVHRLAGLMGHPVDARSVVGRGSVFAVSLPVVDAPRLAADVAAPRTGGDGDGALVMVVDDDRDVRSAIERALTNRNYAVLPAASGQEARDLARWAGRPPAVIIADYRLAAHETGVQVIEAIRAGYPGAEIAAIILTGEQRLDDVPDGVLVLRKPIAPSQLCTLLQRPTRTQETSTSAIR